MRKPLAILCALWAGVASAQTVSNPIIPPTSTLLPLNNTWTGSNTFTGPVKLPVNTTGCTGAVTLGLDATGATDNKAKFDAIMTAAAGASVCVDFGSGTYLFSSSPTYTLGLNQTLTVSAEGGILLFPASNGFNLSYTVTTGYGYKSSAFNSIGVTYETSSPGTYDAVTINGNITYQIIANTTSFYNNTYVGSDNGAAYFWSHAKNLKQTSNVNVVGDNYHGQIANIITGTDILYQTANTDVTASGSFNGSGGTTTTIPVTTTIPANVAGAVVVDVTTGYTNLGTMSASASGTNNIVLTSPISSTFASSGSADVIEFALQPSQLNVSQESVWWAGKAIDAEGYWQGVNVTQSNFTGVGYGVYCNAFVVEYQCTVSQSQVNASHDAIYAYNITNFNLTGNDLYAGIYNGSVNGDGVVKMVNVSNSQITGNNVTAAAATGYPAPTCVVFGGVTGTGNISFTGNEFSGCQQSPIYSASISGTTETILSYNQFSSGQIINVNGITGTGTWNGRFTVATSTPISTPIVGYSITFTNSAAPTGTPNVSSATSAPNYAMSAVYTLNRFVSSGNVYAFELLASGYGTWPYSVNELEGIKNITTYGNTTAYTQAVHVYNPGTGANSPFINSYCGGSVTYPLGTINGDYDAVITTGTAATRCKLNFVTPFSFAPDCIVTPYAPASTGAITTVTVGTSTIDWQWTTSVANAIFSIKCSATP